MNDSLCFMELETLQGITSIHLVPRVFTSSAVKEIRGVFEVIRDNLRQNGVVEIINLIDPDPKLHKLHTMFGFQKLGTWRELDVYQIYC